CGGTSVPGRPASVLECGSALPLSIRPQRYANFLTWICILASGTLLFPASTRSQPLTFNTLAGYAGHGTSDGIGATARFNNPWGVAADSSGNVYVADTANHTIRKITPGGISSTLAGLTGASWS